MNPTESLARNDMLHLCARLHLDVWYTVLTLTIFAGYCETVCVEEAFRQASEAAKAWEKR